CTRQYTRPVLFTRIQYSLALHPRIAKKLPSQTCTTRSLDLDANSSRRFRLRSRFHPQRPLGLANVFVPRPATNCFRSIENQIKIPRAFLQRVRRLRDETNAHRGLLSRPFAAARNFRGRE